MHFQRIVQVIGSDGSRRFHCCVQVRCKTPCRFVFAGCPLGEFRGERQAGIRPPGQVRQPQTLPKVALQPVGSAHRGRDVEGPPRESLTCADDVDVVASRRFSAPKEPRHLFRRQTAGPENMPCDDQPLAF